MVSVISLASMSALSQAEEEVEVEEYAYGGAAGSKSGWPRPRPGYLPHREDAGYDTAAGLGSSPTRFPMSGNQDAINYAL